MMGELGSYIAATHARTGRDDVDEFSLHMDAIKTCLYSEAPKHSDIQLCVTFGLCAASMTLLLLACSLLVWHRCKVLGEHPRDSASCSLYGFLGNLSNTVGALLSRQLTVVIVMGAFAASVDAVNFISVLCPVFFCWNSESARRRRMMRRRRRQYLMAVSVLMIVSGGYLTSTVNPGPPEGPLTGRRLLHVVLTQDHAVVLGYILGIIAFVIACTAKIPTLCRVQKGHALTKAGVFSGMLCSLAAALYASALLFHSTGLDLVLGSLPWLLSALCCACLDLLILVIYWCRRGTGPPPESCSPNTESLLELGTGAGDLTKNILAMKKQRKKNNVKKQTEMGCYFDVGDPLCKATEAKEGVLEGQPHRKRVQEVRVQKLCFLDSSWTSSSDSSDLEWDFAEANSHWNNIPVKAKKGNEFPLQEWPKKAKTFGICICGIPGGPEKTRVPGIAQECVSAGVDG